MQAILDEHRAEPHRAGGGPTSCSACWPAGHEADHASVRILLNDLTATTIASANGNHWEDANRGGARCTTAACARPPSSCAP